MLDFSIKYDEPFDAAYQRHLRELREFAACCRETLPLPSYAELTPDQRARYTVLREKMKQFTPHSPFSEKYVAILHSTPVGLLAASEVFEPHLNSIVHLLPHERKEWVCDPKHSRPGLFWTFWWTFHEETSPETNDYFRKTHVIPANVSLWQLNYGRGGNASCEIWLWDGESLSFLSKAGGVVEEEGHVTQDEYL